MFRQSKIYRWTGKGSTESMYNLLFFNRIYGSSCSWKSRYVEKNSRFPEQIFREQYKSSKHRQNWTEFKNKKRYSTNIDLYIFFENYMRSDISIWFEISSDIYGRLLLRFLVFQILRNFKFFETFPGCSWNRIRSKKTYFQNYLTRTHRNLLQLKQFFKNYAEYCRYFKR